MAETVAGTAQSPPSQTSLNLPAQHEQSNAGRDGQHLHLPQLHHHEPDQDPVRRGCQRQAGHLREASDLTDQWDSDHYSFLPNPDLGQQQGEQGEEEPQRDQQQTVGQGQAPADVSVWECSARGSI